MSSQVLIWLYFFLLNSYVYCQNHELTISNGEYVNMIEEHSKKILEKLGDVVDAYDLWLKMMDSSTKIPTGMMNGNAFDLENFDECYNIKSGDIYGKYCLGTIQSDVSSKFGLNTTFARNAMLHPSIQPRLSGLERYGGYHWAVCVPCTMKAEEISYLFQNYSEDFCYSKLTEPELSTGAIITIVVLGIFLLTIIASTAFDIYLYYTKKESPHELFIAFSYLHNGRKLFASTTNPDQLLCLNGIRAISMMWIIIGHDFENAGIYGPITNMNGLKDWEHNVANSFINGYSISVDSFFLIGGLVHVYSFLRTHIDKGVKFNLPLFYLHRYLRLTPPVAIMVLIHTFILPYVGNGPLWKTVDVLLIQACQDSWWPTLLYISNYFLIRICNGPTWYLNVDMQLFILSPLILIPLTKWPKYGLYALWILAFGGVLVPFIATYVQEIYINMPDQITYMYGYYIQTYMRFGPYVIGMIYGYFIYKIKKQNQKLDLRPVIVALLWLIILAGLVACLYSGHYLYVATSYNKWANSLYFGFNAPAWAVGVGGIVFLCITGYGGPINGFLSLPIFQFIGKLSYSMYLIHYGLIIVRYSVMRNPFIYSNINIMHHFWGDFMITVVLSMILCLSFESPVMILEKHLFGKRAPRGQAKKKVEV